jgi:hypothetical protein
MAQAAQHCAAFMLRLPLRQKNTSGVVRGAASRCVLGQAAQRHALAARPAGAGATVAANS